MRAYSSLRLAAMAMSQRSAYLSSVGNKRDHLMDQMDLLTSLYSDFVMDDREVVFHSIAGRSSDSV